MKYKKIEGDVPHHPHSKRFFFFDFSKNHRVQNEAQWQVCLDLYHRNALYTAFMG
jgi:hypothetical protein